ncbi:MAG: aminoacyl-tRNA hydrolase [Micrococcales bacterium]|nr:aminoacyl-tRNA hydrolase [Micrococcales bacterium]
MWLIAGLGNPGAKYAATRHNLGYLVADELAARTGVGFASRANGRALAAAVRIGLGPGGVPGPRAVLAKPLSYMNLSGGPVSQLVAYFGIDPEHVIVVHDDLDLPAFELKLKRGGGEGGHNGLKDISKALGTKDYIRVRAGIGRPPGQVAAADYVLGPFPQAQNPDVADLVERAANAVEMIVLKGLDSAQLKFHSKDQT